MSSFSLGWRKRNHQSQGELWCKRGCCGSEKGPWRTRYSFILRCTPSGIRCAEKKTKTAKKIWILITTYNMAFSLNVLNFVFFFFILADCFLAEMPAGIFGIYFTFVSLHILCAFRHQREGLDWHFDKQKQRSEAAYLCSLSGSHRQSEIRVFFSLLSNYIIKKVEVVGFS